MTDHQPLSPTTPSGLESSTDHQDLREWVTPTIAQEPLQRAQSGSGFAINDGTSCS